MAYGAQCRPARVRMLFCGAARCMSCRQRAARHACVNACANEMVRKRKWVKGAAAKRGKAPAARTQTTQPNIMDALSSNQSLLRRMFCRAPCRRRAMTPERYNATTFVLGRKRSRERKRRGAAHEEDVAAAHAVRPYHDDEMTEYVPRWHMLMRQLRRHSASPPTRRNATDGSRPASSGLDTLVTPGGCYARRMRVVVHAQTGEADEVRRRVRHTRALPVSVRAPSSRARAP